MILHLYSSLIHYLEFFCKGLSLLLHLCIHLLIYSSGPGVYSSAQSSLLGWIIFFSLYIDSQTCFPLDTVSLVNFLFSPEPILLVFGEESEGQKGINKGKEKSHSVG